MTTTLEKTSPQSTVESDAPRTVYDIIGDSLAEVEEMDEAEMDRQLENLILCTRRIGLLQYMKEERLDEFVEVVPNAAELVRKIHDTADMVLENEKLDGDSLMVIANCGIASDVTRDPSLLDKTLGAIKDQSEFHVAPLAKALTIARTEKRTFTEVYKIIKHGGTAVKSTTPFVPMSKRPDFHQDHPYAAYLSTPISTDEAEYKTRHRHAPVPLNANGEPVTIDEAVFGIQKDPATGLFADQTKD